MPILDIDQKNTYEIKLPVCDDGYAEIILMGDFQFGNPEFSSSFLQRYIKLIEEQKHMRALFMGDYFEASDFTADYRMISTNNMRFREQIKDLVGFFQPVQDRILCAVYGNHDERILRISAVKRVLDSIGVPNYLEYILHENLNKDIIVAPPQEGLNLILRVGPQVYTIHVIHGSTAARYRTFIQIEKLMENYSTDIVAHGHNHVLDVKPYLNFITEYNDGIPVRKVRQRLGVLTGCFLRYGGWAESKSYRMNGMGAPILRLYKELNFIEPILPQQTMEFRTYFTPSYGLLPIERPTTVYPDFTENLNPFGVKSRCLSLS